MTEVTCCICSEVIGHTDGMLPAIECPECYEAGLLEGE
jgi:hypothetical protein